MPFPTDESVMKLSAELLSIFDSLFGRHPSFRAAHAKGLMLSGRFTPTAGAAQLSSAPHFAAASTPVLARFSNSTGVPQIPDGDANANPRGLAVRFMLGPRQHTDIVAHSTNGFPTRTGDEFLHFLRALASSDMQAPSDPAHPKPIELFLGSHPAALAFVQTPKPTPASFASEQYFAVSAYHFTNAQHKTCSGKYQLLPEAGRAYLSAEEAAAASARSPDFLLQELKQRLASSPVVFRVVLQLAAEGDVTDDSTVRWPDDRPVVELGLLTLDAVVPNEAQEAQQVIMDPIPRVAGIEASADPLNDVRAALYLLSGRRRRADPPAATAAGTDSRAHTNGLINGKADIHVEKKESNTVL